MSTLLHDLLLACMPLIYVWMYVLYICLAVLYGRLASSQLAFNLSSEHKTRQAQYLFNLAFVMLNQFEETTMHSDIFTFIRSFLPPEELHARKRFQGNNCFKCIESKVKHCVIASVVITSPVAMLLHAWQRFYGGSRKILRMLLWVAGSFTFW